MTTNGSNHKQWQDIGILMGPDYYPDNKDLHEGMLNALGERETHK
ncbi:MAG: hypothetical protein Q4E65_08535 [Clostridia bacterium]|nr:hypothetical protein [Clostridia bacterium]